MEHTDPSTMTVIHPYHAGTSLVYNDRNEASNNQLMTHFCSTQTIGPQISLCREDGVTLTPNKAASKPSITGSIRSTALR